MQIAGYAGIDRAGEIADVMTIAVAPAAQGQGWGRRLMDHLVPDARDSGAELPHARGARGQRRGPAPL